MSDTTKELRSRAQELDEDFYDNLDEKIDDGGGCMELAEALSEARNDTE